MLVYPLVLIVSFWVMLKLSEHIELRRGRWLQITISIPIILALTYIVQVPTDSMKPLIMPGIVLMLVWIIIWRGNVAYLMGVLVTNTINGSTFRLTGVVPDYAYARRAMKRREFEDAIPLIETELDKDLTHYEGVCMLYQSLNASGKLADAVAVMEFAVEQDYSPEQKEVLQRELQQARMDLFNSRESSEPEVLRKSKVLRRMLTTKAKEQGPVDCEPAS